MQHEQPPVAKVFVGHAYNPRCGSYNLADFRLAVRAAIASVEQALQVSVEPVFEFQNPDNQVRDMLVAALQIADCGIIDVSDLNANVLYELGYLHARGVPVLIVKSNSSIRANYALPFYVPKGEAVVYESLDRLRFEVEGYLCAHLRA